MDADTTSSNSVDVASQEVNATISQVFCYACGMREIDPEMDSPGSFGDARLQWTPSGKKMYNYTCDIAHQMGLDEKWMRKCPHGVKSCFYSKTSYKTDGKNKYTTP